MNTDNSIQQLLDVIPDYPGQRIMHFADSQSILTDQLSLLCADRGYEYQILSTDEEFVTMLRDNSPSQHTKAKIISLDQARYHIQAKMYDYVFVEIDIDDKNHFLKTLYPAMKNSAMLFVLYPKTQSEQKEQWRIEAEADNYVAFGSFDLNNTISIISTRKMHGWGG